MIGLLLIGLCLCYLCYRRRLGAKGYCCRLRAKVSSKGLGSRGRTERFQSVAVLRDISRTMSPASLTSTSTSNAPAIPTTDIELGKQIGKGGWGTVVAGNWLGMAVAVKAVTDPSKAEVLMQEAAMLATLRHPCICNFYGTCFIQGHLMMVMELLTCSLLELIEDEVASMKLLQTCSIAHDTAQGIAYLHRNKILHRDVKTANVMMDEVCRAKVCDFGLSRELAVKDRKESLAAHLGADDGSNASRLSTTGIGTFRYMAPELMQGSVGGEFLGVVDQRLHPLPANTKEGANVRYDKACDVYSFGLLLWELTHRQLAFHEHQGLAVAMAIAPSGVRPSFQLPAGLEAMEPLISLCWHNDPGLRPSMAACAEELGRNLKLLQSVPA